MRDWMTSGTSFLWMPRATSICGRTVMGLSTLRGTSCMSRIVFAVPADSSMADDLFREVPEDLAPKTSMHDRERRRGFRFTLMQSIFLALGPGSPSPPLDERLL